MRAFCALKVLWELINGYFRQQRAMQGLGQGAAKCRPSLTADLGVLCPYPGIGSFAEDIGYSFPC